jgi:gluconolactonase
MSEAPKLQEIASGLAFPEGPVWMPDGSIVLVEIEAGRVTRVRPDGAREVVATPGGGPNGAAVGPDGALTVCNNGGFEWHHVGGLTIPGHQARDYSGGRIERVDLATGAVRVLYDRCGAHPLRGPNDLVFDRDGGFWFTDHGKMRERERDRGGLYWARADGSEIREVVFPLDSPNGVGLSPDGRRVYVAETFTGRVWWWEIAEPGVIRRPALDLMGHGGTLLAGLPGLQLFDSLAVDAEGWVCVATIGNGGISAISPDGARVEHVPLPDPLVTNLCFGGPDLRTAYATLSGTGRLVCFPWPRAGLRLAY